MITDEKEPALAWVGKAWEFLATRRDTISNCTLSHEKDKAATQGCLEYLQMRELEILTVDKYCYYRLFSDGSAQEKRTLVLKRELEIKKQLYDRYHEEYAKTLI